MDGATATYTADDVARALNSACDDVITAAEMDEAGARDALNLLINTALARLNDPDVTLCEVADTNYGLSDEELAEREDVPEDERALAVVLGWIEAGS